MQNTVVTARQANVGTFACSGGGSFIMRWLRPLSDPTGGQFQRDYSGCRLPGLSVGGGQQVTITELMSEPGRTRWAGSVRFTGYRNTSTSTGREQRYDGLATASGIVNTGPADGQSMSMELTGFTFSDSPGSLLPNLRLSSTRWQVQRIQADALREHVQPGRLHGLARHGAGRQLVR